jgi:hypothetical protein
MQPKLKNMRLRLPPGIAHSLRELALSRGASESATAVLLIGQALDATRLAANASADAMNQLIAMMAAGNAQRQEGRAP